jgi:putative hydrolase of the HAD superfamily
LTRAVLFDLDNTLYPELDYVRSGFKAVAAHLAQRHDIDAQALFQQLLGYLGQYGRGRVFDLLLEDLGLHSRPAVHALVYIYRSHRPELSLYPDAEPAIRGLIEHDLRLGIITNGRASMQRQKIAALRLDRWFDPIVCCDELGADCWKPAPTAFRLALHLLQVDAAETMYVGDDPDCDFDSPRALGMRTVQIIRSDVTVRRSANADHVVTSLAELARYTSGTMPLSA